MLRRVIERSSGGNADVGRAVAVVVAVTVAVVITAVSLGEVASPPPVPSFSVDDPAPVMVADGALKNAAADVLYPDNCQCGFEGQVTIDPFGTGLLVFLTN